jgi:hypothetical protein
MATKFVKMFRFISVVLALCACNGVATAKGLPRYGVFVYSSFCISPMSGDLGGDRMTLIRLADGDTLVYEYTDGSTHALIARELALDGNSETLRFEVNVQGAAKSAVSGNFSADGRSLTLQGLPFQGENKNTLLLVTDFAAPVAECKPLPRGQ